MFQIRNYFQRIALFGLLLTSIMFLMIQIIIAQNRTRLISPVQSNPAFTIQQVDLNPNNISSWFVNNGMFDCDTRIPNTPGFEWPRGTGKFAIYSSGINIGAYVNGQLRMASALFTGEYAPGYVMILNGLPVAQTDGSFKIYSIKHGDSWSNNPDWLNWGLMVPYGAPFIDVNHNGIYDPFVDTPGVKGAAQTLFVCLTDGFPGSHNTYTGFGGGTPPLFAEVHMTAWATLSPGTEDMQFIRWEVINKNITKWDSTYFSVVCDADLGDPTDDYIGSDSSRQLGFCYNSEDFDEVYFYHPPAVGLRLLNCSGTPNLGMTSFTFFSEPNVFNTPVCQKEPESPIEAYNYMKGLKRDGTPWEYPPGGSSQYITKYCFSGDPENGQGWNEWNGFVGNCGGSLTGPPDTNYSFKVMVMSSGSKFLTVEPGASYGMTIAQIVRRGNNNFNSVTMLKHLSDYADSLCSLGFIGIKGISSTVPSQYELFQNYPNPFNPSTKIKFEIPLSRGVPGGRGVSPAVTLKIYDLLGREVATLVNEGLQPGTYEVNWDASNYPSGVYFYKLYVTNNAGGYTDTKKMVLLK